MFFMSRKINISFFVIDYSCGGGVERVTADLSDIFLKNGINVSHLVSLFQSNDIPAIKYPEKLTIEVLSPTSKKEYQKVFENFFQKNRPDFFIFQGDNMTITKAILQAAHSFQIKAIPQYHGSAYAYLKKYSDAQNHNFFKKLFATIVFPFKKQKLKNVIELATSGFVCVSEGAANELKHIFNHSKSITERIKVIRNPIFINEQIQSEEKQKKISFVSRLEIAHKNAFLIVKIWKHIHSQFPDWTLEIFGEGRLKSKMQTYCEENNIQNIRFMGFTNNIYSHLASSSIAVSTSNCEGFSMAIAEAMANKNAIVITDSDGGISDMIIHEETGLIAPKNNDKILAKNIALLIEKSTIRTQLADNAYKHIISLKNQNIFEQWIDLLKKEL